MGHDGMIYITEIHKLETSPARKLVYWHANWFISLFSYLTVGALA